MSLSIEANVPRLVKMYEDSDSDVRSVAATTFGQLAQRGE